MKQKYFKVVETVKRIYRIPARTKLEAVRFLKSKDVDAENYFVNFGPKRLVEAEEI